MQINVSEWYDSLISELIQAQNFTLKFAELLVMLQQLLYCDLSYWILSTLKICKITQFKFILVKLLMISRNIWYFIKNVYILVFLYVQIRECGYAMSYIDTMYHCLKGWLAQTTRVSVRDQGRRPGRGAGWGQTPKWSEANQPESTMAWWKYSQKKKYLSCMLKGRLKKTLLRFFRPAFSDITSPTTISASNRTSGSLPICNKPTKLYIHNIYNSIRKINKTEMNKFQNV